MVRRGDEKVRLTDKERAGILQAVKEASKREGFEWKVISLFGSRVELSKKGGDIDLYILIKPRQGLDLFSIKRTVRMLIREQLGEQKIDVVLDDSVTDLGAFGGIVMDTKKDLWTKE